MSIYINYLFVGISLRTSYINLVSKLNWPNCCHSVFYSLSVFQGKKGENENNKLVPSQAAASFTIEKMAYFLDQFAGVQLLVSLLPLMLSTVHIPAFIHAAPILPRCLYGTFSCSSKFLFT